MFSTATSLPCSFDLAGPQYHNSIFDSDPLERLCVQREHVPFTWPSAPLHGLRPRRNVIWFSSSATQAISSCFVKLPLATPISTYRSSRTSRIPQPMLCFATSVRSSITLKSPQIFARDGHELLLHRKNFGKQYQRLLTRLITGLHTKFSTFSTSASQDQYRGYSTQASSNANLYVTSIAMSQDNNLCLRSPRQWIFCIGHPHPDSFHGYLHTGGMPYT